MNQILWIVVDFAQYSVVPVVGNAKHPALAEDTLSTFGKRRQLSPDIQLPGHPAQLLIGKVDAIKSGVRPHALLVSTGEPKPFRKLRREDAWRYRERSAEELAGLRDVAYEVSVPLSCQTAF